VFIAVICLTELRPMEALEKEIKPGDVNLDKRTIDVAGRKKPVIICEPLHEILRRWLPRAGGHYLLPIVARTEPWPSGGPQNPWARLKSACRTLGLPDYTPGSLYQFGRADADRLKGTTSPFRLEVGDGGLTVVPVSISRLRDEIMATASTMSQSTRWVMRTTFDVLGRLLSDDASTDKLTPSLISEFEAELEGFSQSKRKVTIEYFHRVCKWAIASGYRDLDPFSGRPGFYAPIARKSKPPKRPFLPKRFRLAELDASVDVPGITSPWDAWDAAVCPVHVRDDGHLVVFRRDKGPLSGSGRKLFKALEEKYPGGFTSNELRKIVGDSRGIIERWREKDADCLEAIQLAMRKGGLYRFGRSES
jgi:integrase